MTIREKFGDAEEGSPVSGYKTEWEQTTDGSEKEQDESDGKKPYDEWELKSGFEEAKPENRSGDFNIVSEPSFGSPIKLKSKPGYPPSDRAIKKALHKALSRGWQTVYVYKEDGKTPDLGMAQYIQNYIVKKGMSGQIKCCLDGQKYHERAEERAGRKPKPPVHDRPH